MNVFTETPSLAAASSTPALRLSPRRRVMRADMSPSGGALVFDVGQLHVVTGDPCLDAARRQDVRQLGGGVGQQVQDAGRDGAGQDGGDPLGGFGHGVVAQLAHRHHVGAQAVHHQ